MIRRVAIARLVAPLQHLHPLEDHDDADGDATDEDAKELQLQDLSRGFNTCIHFMMILMMMLIMMMLMMMPTMLPK